MAGRLEQDAPQNSSESKHVVNPLLSNYQGTLFWNASKHLISQAAKSVVLGLFRNAIPEPSWDKESRQWVLSQVRDDARHTLDYSEKSYNF